MSLPTAKMPTRIATIRELQEILDGMDKPYFPQFAQDVNGENRVLGKPHFTGYHKFFEGFDTHSQAPEAIVEVPCDLKPVMVGHWLWWNPLDLEDRNLRVTVPSLTCGIYKRGQVFDLGTDRFAVDAPHALMDTACQIGYVKLLQLVADLESGKLDEESIA